MSDDYLLLKWGTLKGWRMPEDSECFRLLQEYFSEGSPMSAMADRPNEARKTVLCKLIDAFEGTIQNDWSGEMLTKDAAKKYVMEYGTDHS